MRLEGDLRGIRGGFEGDSWEIRGGFEGDSRGDWVEIRGGYEGDSRGIRRGVWEIGGRLDGDRWAIGG